MATIQEIIDYITETPYNTNPNVLVTLLNNLDTGETYPDATGRFF